MACVTDRMDCHACPTVAKADDVSIAAHSVGLSVSDLMLGSIDCLRCSYQTMSWNFLNFCLFLCLAAADADAVAVSQPNVYSILRRF